MGRPKRVRSIAFPRIRYGSGKDRITIYIRREGNHGSYVLSSSGTSRPYNVKSVGTGTICTLYKGGTKGRAALFLKGNALLRAPQIAVGSRGPTGILLRRRLSK